LSLVFIVENNSTSACVEPCTAADPV